MSARFPLFLAAILLLLWPALLNGGPLIFFDSASYLDQGRQAVEEALRLVSSRLPPGAAGEGAAAVAAEGAGSANIVRSAVYSIFAYAASATPLGEWGVIALHSVLIVILLAMLAGRGLLEAARPADIVLAILFCASLTSLPWFVSYLMPDILAAAVILCGMLVAAGLERLTLLGKLFVFGAASFAMLSHYGHIPLGVGVGAVALGLLLVQRRLTVAAVAVAALPVLVALGGNAVVNRVAFHEPGVGVATKRLPVLLARSLADGPARWHLEENCDTEGYAICEVFEDGFSSNLGVILWSDEGLGGASPGADGPHPRRGGDDPAARLHGVSRRADLVLRRQRGLADLDLRHGRFQLGAAQMAAGRERRYGHARSRPVARGSGRDGSRASGRPDRRHGADPRLRRPRPSGRGRARARDAARRGRGPRDQRGDLRRPLGAGRPLSGPGGLDHPGSGRAFLAEPAKNDTRVVLTICLK